MQAASARWLRVAGLAARSQECRGWGLEVWGWGLGGLGLVFWGLGVREMPGGCLVRGMSGV